MTRLTNHSATAKKTLDPATIVPGHVLEAFPAADAELVSRRDLQRRTDSKFLLPQGILGDLLGQLDGKYALLHAGCQAFATYRTLYFDTPDYRCFHDHRRGRRPRYKVRIRHYDDRALSFIEIKAKRSDSLTVKYRQPRIFGDHELSAVDRDFVCENSSVPGAVLGPVVWTDFRRLTLLSLDAPERLTIDVGLEYRYGEHVVLMSGVAIVEVKQSPYCVRTPIMRLLRRAGVRPTSASKYCSAIAFTRPMSRKNRLLPALRAMERLRT